MKYEDFERELYGSDRYGYATYQDLERIAGQKVRGSLLWMAIGILITGVTSYYTAIQILSNHFLIQNFQNIMIGVIVLELITVMAFSGLIYKVSAFALKGMFLFYALLNGITLSTIILAYDLGVIFTVFLGTFVLFAVLAIYGYITKEDLTKYRPLLMGGIISLVVMGLINIFLRNSTLDWIASMMGVVIFIVFTAYDINRIKNNVIQYAMVEDSSIIDKIEIHGALSLYLDFINLFLYILRFFGKKGRD